MVSSRRAHIAIAGAASVLVAALLATLVAAVWPLPEAPVPSASSPALIRGATVIRPRMDRVEHGMDVLIADGRIQAVGERLQPTPGARVMDAEGRYLIPGLWDAHAHTWQVSPQLHLPLYVAGGVTSLRDMMGCPEPRDPLVACAEDKRRWTTQVAAGRRAGPRIPVRASFYFHRGDLSSAEIRSRARLYASRPIHLVKVYDGLSAGGYRSLIAVAAELGLPVEGHVPRSVGLAAAIRSGQRAIDHARDLPRACASRPREKATPTEELEHMVATFDEPRCLDLLDRMAAAGVWYVPTHVTREEDARADDPVYRTEDTRLDYLDPLSRWAWMDDAEAVRVRYPGQRGRQALDRYLAHGRRITGLAHSRGVRILAGTDTVLPGFRLHDELAHLAVAGLDPMDVLKAATSEPADYSGLGDHLGDIAPGYLADLVLLDADPLADVANTREIRAVVLAGRLYDRAALDELLRFVARRARDPRVAARILRGFLTSPMSAEM